MEIRPRVVHLDPTALRRSTNTLNTCDSFGRAPGLGQLLQCVIIWRRRRTSTENTEMINVSVGPCTYRILKVKAGLQFTHPTAVSHLQQLFSVDLCVISRVEFEILYNYIHLYTMPRHWWLHQNQRLKTLIRSPGLEHRPGQIHFRVMMLDDAPWQFRHHWTLIRKEAWLSAGSFIQHHSIQVFTSLAKSGRSLFSSFRSQRPQPFWRCSAKELQPHSDS